MKPPAAVPSRAGCGSLELAQARIGARLGAAPAEAAWQAVESARDLSTLLQAARGSALACWVQELDAQMPADEIEARLRRRWLLQVHELAAWMPEAWQPALRECARALWLPAALQLRRGESGAAGEGDEVASIRALAALPVAPVALRSSQSGPAMPTRPRASAARPDDAAAQLLQAWLQHLRSLLPAERGANRELQGTLWALLQRHLALFPQSADAAGARLQLRRDMLTLMRRSALRPVLAFAWLVLQGLEFERLRAALLRRAWFAAPWPGSGS